LQLVKEKEKTSTVCWVCQSSFPVNSGNILVSKLHLIFELLTLAVPATFMKVFSSPVEAHKGKDSSMLSIKIFLLRKSKLLPEAAKNKYL